jgi:aminoglycoside 6-adenylyltransferase
MAMSLDKEATMMPVPPTENEVLACLIRLARNDERIRALILESSSRTVERSRIDALSDYDVLLVVQDTAAFWADVGWLEAYGTPMVRLPNLDPIDETETNMRLVLYTDGTKIDYAIWSVAVLRQVLEAPALPDRLDTGYQVLVDKDGLAILLRPPTYTAHIPGRPNASEYQALVEEFWWETAYVAKNLWRDQLVNARYSFDQVIKVQLLRTLLEWRIELDHHWSLRPGPTGRWLKERLDPLTWDEFAATYVGPAIEENWEALFRATALFRRIAVEVGTALGYQYPSQLDSQLITYLQGIRNLPR